ncbi:MAG: PQQ-dependent sugar dehydrogenase [Flavobacteriales bacterium]|nr:PQQ-dependent sugar dehydrogenase [Flavobacteriales bacterium]
MRGHLESFLIACGVAGLGCVAPYFAATAQTLPMNFNDALVMGGWSSPVGCTWDANGRMYVWEKRGRVWIVENGIKLATPLLNIEQEVGNWGDHGMLGFALDPNYLVNGHIYVMYVVDRHYLLYYGTGSYDPFATEGNAAAIVRITRYTATGPSFNVADVNSRLVLFGETMQTGAPITFNTHGAGTLVFGRDGTLLASMGEGASAVGADPGSSSDSYYVQALADGIIRPEENVGAFRAQMVNSHSGKVLRLDPATGNGVPSNPWFDASVPRAPKSRVWALGLRNPYRMRLVPNTGSTDPSQAQPGTLLIGDVGWSTWEELNVCDAPGLNFGWPIYEGMEASAYAALTIENKDVPNPIYDGINCNLAFLRFQDLLVQDRPSHLGGHPNPCNTNLQLPGNIPKFFHERPAIDWKHGNQSRCGAFNGNTAITYDLDDPLSPVPGPRFGGYAAMAGPSSSELALPSIYANSSFHGDYAGGWIRRLKLNALNKPDSVFDFASGLGAVNFIGADPNGCIVYIKYNATEVRRICYALTVNLPPVVVATQSALFGPSPLSVSFNASGSSDPENGALTYEWNFGDGTPTSNAANPVHVFNAPPGVPTLYTVSLTVTDNIGQSVVRALVVSVNNTPPQVNITSFAQGAFYPVGVDTTFQLAASVTDAEHGPAQLSYAWVTSLHHNTHVHPGSADGNVFSSTVISGEGCTEDTYFFDVTLTVTDAAGLSTTVTKFLYPRCHAIAPTAVIGSSTNAGAAPLSVSFDGTASYDPGSIVSYVWDFSDGTFSSSATPTKVFTETGDHLVTLTVTDNDGLTGTATKVISVITFDPPQCVGPAGTVLREYFLGIGGTTVLDLLNYPLYPNSPNGSTNLSQFQGPGNFANNFGTRVRGYIVPPQTGNYIFTLTSDDASVAYLSLNADPRYKQVICSVPGNTLETEYTKYTTQTSATITLQAGVYYYVELIHKDGSGTDHFALRWQTPSNSTRTIIPGSALVRWQNCAPSVRLRADLEGPWNASLNLMNDNLRSAGLITAVEPFTALGFTQAGGGGGETVSPARLAVTGKNAVVDWVLVELRNASTPTQIVATRSALLERDGDIIGTNGYPRLIFSVAPGNYYISVRHRNHFGAMTLSPVALSANEVGVDLTLSTTATYGTNAQYTLPNGRRALWSGNVLLDATLRYVGSGNDRDPILTAIGGSVPTNTVSGYRQEDVNLDGAVRYVGANNDRDPILQNIGGSVPTAVRSQQLP